MRVAGGEGGRGGCVTLGAMFAASRDARPGGGRACRRSRAARPAAGPGRVPCAPRPAGERPGRPRGPGSRAAPRRGFGSPRGAEPLGRGLARNGGGAGLAAEVAQPPPLPRPSLKKGCASRHFSSLKIQLSPSSARLAFALGLVHAGLPGRPGTVPAVASPSPAPPPGALPEREAGPSVWAAGGSARQPGRATAPCWRAPSSSAG